MWSLVGLDKNVFQAYIRIYSYVCKILSLYSLKLDCVCGFVYFIFVFTSK